MVNDLSLKEEMIKQTQKVYDGHAGKFCTINTMRTNQI